MSLHQIIYTSHSRVRMTSADLVELLDQSRRDNTAAGITGLLLHADGSFMQTIEGEFEAILRLYARIERDPRHDGLILICDEPIAERSYGEWSMAFREITRSEAARVPGFHRSQTGLGPLDRDVARNLMQTFYQTSGLTRRG